jgi:hypothetical protein
MISGLTAQAFVAVWLALMACPPADAPALETPTGATGPGLAVGATAASQPYSSPLDENDLVEATDDWPAESAEVVEDDGDQKEERDGFACWGLVLLPSWSMAVPAAVDATVALWSGRVAPAPLYLLLVRLTC